MVYYILFVGEVIMGRARPDEVIPVIWQSQTLVRWSVPMKPVLVISVKLCSCSLIKSVLLQTHILPLLHSTGNSRVYNMCLMDLIRSSLPDQTWKYWGVAGKTGFILICNLCWLSRGEDAAYTVGSEWQLRWRCFRCVGLWMFFQACKLLADDYEQVRSAAVQLIWVLSQLYPERYVLHGLSSKYCPSYHPNPESFVLVGLSWSC